MRVVVILTTPWAVCLGENFSLNRVYNTQTFLKVNSGDLQNSPVTQAGTHFEGEQALNDERSKRNPAILAI